MKRITLVKNLINTSKSESENILPQLIEDAWSVIVSYIRITDIQSIMNFITVSKICFIIIKPKIYDLFKMILQNQNYFISYKYEDIIPNEKYLYNFTTDIENIKIMGHMIHRLLKSYQRANFIYIIENIDKYYKKKDDNYVNDNTKSNELKNRSLSLDTLVGDSDIDSNSDTDSNNNNNNEEEEERIYCYLNLLRILNLCLYEYKYGFKYNKKKDNVIQIDMITPNSSTKLGNIYYFIANKKKIIPLYKLNKIKTIMNLVKIDKKENNKRSAKQQTEIENNALKNKFLKYIKKFNNNKQEIYLAAYYQAKKYLKKKTIIYNTIMKVLKLRKPKKNDKFGKIIYSYNNNNKKESKRETNKKGKHSSSSYIFSEELKIFRNNCFVYKANNIEGAKIFYKLYNNSENILGQITKKLDYFYKKIVVDVI